jgi:general secretion pathway protein J
MCLINSRNKGFTLIEVLIALFIFVIIATIMTHALKIIFESQKITDSKAKRLADLQIALLLFSRDIEQAIERPIIDNQESLQPPFIGTKHRIILTHAGLANPEGLLPRSTLQRTSYFITKKTFIRRTWPVLDQAVSTSPDDREILSMVDDLTFQYFDSQGQSYNSWPPQEVSNTYALPRAVQITLKLSNWGDISQLYLIPGHTFDNRKQ